MNRHSSSNKAATRLSSNPRIAAAERRAAKRRISHNDVERFIAFVKMMNHRTRTRDHSTRKRSPYISVRSRPANSMRRATAQSY